jgi:hypothetical protein
MDIDKALNQAPIGLDFDSLEVEEGPDIEVVVEDLR